MREVILEKCKERSDSWANDVRATLLSCIDLVAAGAVYHFDCATKFRNGRPKESVIGSGRKEDDAKLIYFEHTCEWLESNMNLIRLSEAYEYMVKSAGDNEVYTDVSNVRLASPSTNVSGEIESPRPSSIGPPSGHMVLYVLPTDKPVRIGWARTCITLHTPYASI